MATKMEDDSDTSSSHGDLPMVNDAVDQSLMRAVVVNVLEACKNEKNSNELFIPLDDYKQRTSHYTGLPQEYLEKLYVESAPKETIDSLDLSGRIAVLHIFQEFYAKNQTPNYEDIYQELQKRTQSKLDSTKLLQMMKALGYNYVKTKTKPGAVLMENPKFTFERTHYVTKIRKFRSMNKNIFYLDERIIRIGTDCSENPSIDISYANISDLTNTRDTLFIHVVSEAGYISGIFCQNDINTYKNWLLHMLLPAIIPNSVIVITNNDFHTISNVKPITRYHTKNEMLQWLKERNIPCNPVMSKAELYDLIDRFPQKKHNNSIDAIFRAHGVEVLRLSDRLRPLSLTTHFWSIMKSDKKLLRPKNEDTCQNHIYHIIKDMPKSKWMLYSSVIQAAEKMMSTLDAQIETSLDNYVIDTEYMSSVSSIYN